MRGEMLSHPLDIIGLIDLIIPKIMTSSNNISEEYVLSLIEIEVRQTLCQGGYTERQKSYKIVQHFRHSH